MATTRRASPANLCRARGEDFTSLTLFDRHHRNPPTAPADCMAPREMRARGWRPDARGRWSDPAAAAEVARRLGRAA